MTTQMHIPLSILEEITNGFSVNLRIGRGGYGDVYKGVYNGREIAVRLLHDLRGAECDDQQFENEVGTLLKVKHPNIIELVGYCYETRKRLVEHNGAKVFSEHIYRAICFEYLQGGSLDKRLCDQYFAPNWSTRYNIIKGISEGLEFLHKSQIFHLDLKPSNILLDSSMEPKVADFGLSRLLTQSHIVTKSIIGTRRYMPPEYITDGKISSKNDVFSLGVVMIEIMKEPAGYFDYSEMDDLAQLSQQVLAKWSTVIEATSKYPSDEKHQVKTCIELAICCVDAIRDNRPSTTDILDILNNTETNIPKTQVKGDSGNSMGMANTKMDASRDRLDIQFASSVLEHILLEGSLEPTNVPLALLQHITEDFADKRRIGRGGFAVVYEGRLQNGSVAVKRLSNAHTIDAGLFYHEALCLITVKHENIVRFLGYCSSTEGKVVPNPNPEEITKFIFADVIERLLCFEYIKNGSLDNFLTDELSGLEWHTRYKIIQGICNGLDYLHNEKGIIHRDLKPANILVDDFMVPKITDFGISKLLNGATHVFTSNRTMSYGYTAPEFIQHGEVSFKSDMYSLGAIILDLVTGRKGEPDIKNILRRWRHRWKKSVKYPPFGYHQVTKCIEIASMCLSDSPKKRPYARDILSMLNTIKSPVSPISPYPWELLEFNKLELNFHFEINKHIPCSLELTNVKDDCAAFDIQKPGMLEYGIEPNKGVVPARSKCIIIITLQPREVVPNHTMCKDDFIVRCAAVNEGFTAEDIHEDMFNKSSGKLVDEVTLTVVVEDVDVT